MPGLRRRSGTDLKAEYGRLIARCERLIEAPPPTEEPPLYPEGLERGSDPWRDIWWGNRRYTQRALDGAANLAFAWQLSGNDAYGQLARRILMDCASWDPKGSTGYRYNDEAGMPYNYYFSRTYTFLHALLSEPDRAKCREVMAIRGREMNRHLNPRHLWRPYSSHSNRAWHFLGEVGIAFLGEIPEAEEWVWFAANVFSCVYPVWNDEFGGWHEGSSYWSSYLNRFTWWADVMRAGLGIDAYQKPFFHQVGYYAMYLQPPGTVGGGFGDLTARRRSSSNRRLVGVFAAQAQNPYWQWYVDAHPPRDTGRRRRGQRGGYVEYIRGALPSVEPTPPTDLPSSRCFFGIGQAMLNTNLMDATDNVEVIFKSSPFGSQSHGYESQNAFLLYAFGERLFIRTGRRDSYGSKHHREWMWHTKSVNSITVDGHGQAPRSPEAIGQITGFQTGEAFDYVGGEAGDAYGGRLERFSRQILFAKPEVVVIFDRLAAPDPATYEWHLHAPVEMTVAGQHDIRVVNGGASARANILWPPDLSVTQTDKFDPPPRPRVKLVEYHLTAATVRPERAQHFVTVIRPHRSTQTLQGEAKLREVEAGFLVTVPVSDGKLAVLLRTLPGTLLSGGGLSTDAEVAAALYGRDGGVRHTFASEGTVTTHR